MDKMDHQIAKVIFEETLIKAVSQLKFLNERFNSIDSIWDLFDGTEGIAIKSKANDIKENLKFLLQVVTTYLSKIDKKYKFEKKEITINEYLQGIMLIQEKRNPKQIDNKQIINHE